MPSLSLDSSAAAAPAPAPAPAFTAAPSSSPSEPTYYSFKVFAKYLPPAWGDEEVSKYFTDNGCSVASARKLPGVEGKPGTCAVVELTNLSSMQRALGLTGLRLESKTLSVVVAHDATNPRQGHHGRGGRAKSGERHAAGFRPRADRPASEADKADNWRSAAKPAEGESTRRFGSGGSRRGGRGGGSRGGARGGGRGGKGKGGRGKNWTTVTHGVSADTAAASAGLASSAGKDKQPAKNSTNAANPFGALYSDSD